MHRGPGRGRGRIIQATSADANLRVGVCFLVMSAHYSQSLASASVRVLTAWSRKIYKTAPASSHRTGSRCAKQSLRLQLDLDGLGDQQGSDAIRRLAGVAPADAVRTTQARRRCAIIRGRVVLLSLCERDCRHRSLIEKSASSHAALAQPKRQDQRTTPNLTAAKAVPATRASNGVHHRMRIPTTHPDSRSGDVRGRQRFRPGCAMCPPRCPPSPSARRASR